MACKPGSVRQVAPAGWPFIWGLALPQASCNQPGRWRENARRSQSSDIAPIRFCSRWGLPWPTLLPGPRCALTAPFHPYLIWSCPHIRRFAFCGTFPGVAPAGRYPAPCFHGARTFLERFSPPAAIRPSG